MKIRFDRREVREERAFQLPDPDTYKVLIDAIEPIDAKEGKFPSLRVVYKIVEGETTAEQFKGWTFSEVITLSPNAAWKSNTFFDRLGCPVELVDDIETNDYIGRAVILGKCKHQQSPDGRFTNLVPTFYSKVADEAIAEEPAAEVTPPVPPTPPAPPAQTAPKPAPRPAPTQVAKPSVPAPAPKPVKKLI